MDKCSGKAAGSLPGVVQLPGGMDGSVYAVVPAAGSVSASDGMREQFEAHYDEWRGGCQNWTASNRIGNTYADPKASAAWVHWQASRAAVVVELPRPYRTGHTENGNHPAIDLYDGSTLIPAIEAAGLKANR